MVVTKEKKCEYARKYRQEHKEDYKQYQRDYKALRYEDPAIRASILKTMKLKYYYQGDPIKEIRRLW